MKSLEIFSWESQWGDKGPDGPLLFFFSTVLLLLFDQDPAWLSVNSLPNDKILDWPKLKAFADYKMKVLKVPIAPNYKGVCLQNTSKPHSYHLKIW